MQVIHIFQALSARAKCFGSGLSLAILVIQPIRVIPLDLKQLDHIDVSIIWLDEIPVDLQEHPSPNIAEDLFMLHLQENRIWRNPSRSFPADCSPVSRQ
jgi:hypothetical protein